VVAGTEMLLFDCGNGIPDHLAQIGRLPAVNKLFCTHLHRITLKVCPFLWMNWNAWAGATLRSQFGDPAGVRSASGHGRRAPTSAANTVGSITIPFKFN